MPLKIYYLDDESALLEIFTDIFSSKNREITVFENPETALAKINESPPDLLFLDFRLPNTTGDKIALKLGPGISKALITGDLNVKCEYAFDAIFEKPFKIDLVEEFITSFEK